MRGGWYVDPGPPGDPKGRRLVADRPHQPGDAVLQEQPYAAVLYSDHLASHCDCCLQPAADLLRWATAAGATCVQPVHTVPPVTTHLAMLAARPAGALAASWLTTAVASTSCARGGAATARSAQR